MRFGLCPGTTEWGLGREVGVEDTGWDHSDNGYKGFIVVFFTFVFVEKIP